MKKILKIAKWFFLIFGVLSFVGALLLGGVLIYSVTLGNRAKEEFASKKDVQFVLNRCGLSDKQIVEVANSYESERSFTGDHLDAYVVKVSDLTVEELIRPKRQGALRSWHRADTVSDIQGDALDFMKGWLHEIPWFPSINEIRSDQFYVYLLKISYPGDRPSYVSIVLARPKDNMVYYFSGKL